MIFVEETKKIKKKTNCQLNQKVRMEFTETHLKKGSKSIEQFYLPVKANIMYFDQTAVLMCGENPVEIRKEMFVQRLNMVAVA